MINKNDYILRGDALEARPWFKSKEEDPSGNWNKAIEVYRSNLIRIPSEDYVSRDLFNQVVWERDFALSKLSAVGKSLGSSMDDVRTVIFCKDCRKCRMYQFGNETEERLACVEEDPDDGYIYLAMRTEPYGYCFHAERK